MKISDLSMPEGAMVDILVRAKNGHEITETCVASIRENTPRDQYRLILVDDGSEPPLALEADLAIRSATPSGAVTATNRGLALSMMYGDSQYVLVLDNDTRIPSGDRGWLGRMVAELEQGGEKCAAVGATTNFANPPQHILTAPQTYTNDWRNEREDRSGSKTNPPVPWFVSFAVLLRKDVVRHAGLWDEQFNPGNFEDTDYSLHLRTLGYEIRVARSVYIHHDGHRTFGADLGRLMEVNGKRFREKWGVGRLFDMGMISRDQFRAALGASG